MSHKNTKSQKQHMRELYRFQDTTLYAVYYKKVMPLEVMM